MAVCYLSINNGWAGALTLGDLFYLEPILILRSKVSRLQLHFFSDLPSQRDIHASETLRTVQLSNESGNYL